MESLQLEITPNQPVPSSTIPKVADTESNLRSLRAVVGALHRRKKEVQRELKEPGLAADRERLYALLKELEQIARAFYGLSTRGVL